MIILRMRSSSDAKETLKKLKRMHKFTKELIECFEDKMEDEDDEDYRYDEDEEYDMEKHYRHGGMPGGTRRYRRSM